MARPERNERVIHARIPESLDDEVRRHAGSLGVSVSNLVRNILENAFGLVEDIVADSAEIARSARGEAGSTSANRRTQAPVVLGWTVAFLNLNAICEACNAVLPKGNQAAVGVLRGTGPTPFRCLPCVERLGAPETFDAPK
ncbi:MAG TPA: hypothetical protein VEB21_08275 [Terriglobales bacterium]|nr:hypothetical protein [Terriglobales bacterium]